MTYMYVILNISLVSKKLCFCKCCVTNWQNKNSYSYSYSYITRFGVFLPPLKEAAVVTQHLVCEVVMACDCCLSVTIWYHFSLDLCRSQEDKKTRPWIRQASSPYYFRCNISWDYMHIRMLNMKLYLN